MLGLTIDVGNSAIKFAIFENGKIIKFSRETIISIEKQINSYLNMNYDYICLCSVKPSVLEIINEKYPQIKIVDYNDYDNMIEMNLGNPPKIGSYNQLGTDIAIGCFGAISETDKNVIVVDCGTAITVTAVINKMIEEVYIYPGFRTAKKSLTSNTELLDGDFSIKVKEGKAANTEACIDLAVYHGTNGAIKAIIELLEKRYNKNFSVCITGGDAYEIYIDSSVRDDKLVNKGLDKYIRKIEN